MSGKPVTIIGGGLAGLTWGIGLRQAGVPVSIWEAGHHPRHKTCGEFICGQGQEVLKRLGLLDKLQKAGMGEASTAMFVAGSAQGPARPLRPQALCLSRFTMDALLAKLFQEAGGELRQGQKWQDAFPEGVVRATGRRI